MSTVFQTVDMDLTGYNGEPTQECLLSQGANVSPRDNALLHSGTSLVTLQWEEVLGAEWYVIQYSLNSDFRGSTTRGFKVEADTNPFSSESGDLSSDGCPQKPPTTAVLDVPNNIKKGFKYYWRVFPYSRCRSVCSGPPTIPYSFFINLPNIDLDCDQNVTMSPLQGPDPAVVLVGTNFIVKGDWAGPSFLNLAYTWEVEGGVKGAETANTVQVNANQAGTITVRLCLQETSSSGSSEVCCKEIEIEAYELDIPSSSTTPPETSSQLVSSVSEPPTSSEPFTSEPITSSAFTSSAFESTSEVIESSLVSSGAMDSSSNPCPDKYTGTLRVAIITGEVNGCYIVKPCDLTYECGLLCSVEEPSVVS